MACSFLEDNMSMIVQKFGGTSVENIDRIRNVATIIKGAIEKGEAVVAVVSAMAGVTNSLISQCSAVSVLAKIDQLREYDAAICSGEIISASLLALELDRVGIPAISLQGWQIPIKTNKRFANALVEDIEIKKIKDYIERGITPIITGFQGVTEDFDITTLGKGGSDTSAALIAAALGAIRCDIYTDVDGIFTADPRIVPEARKLENIDATEALRLTTRGAKVLHPRAALAALRFSTQMQVLSSFSNEKGTMIIDSSKQEHKMEKAIIKAITSDNNIIKIKLISKQNSYLKILNLISQNNLIYYSCRLVGTISTKEELEIVANLTDRNKYSELLCNLQDQYIVKNFNFESDIATISLVGYGINHSSDLMHQIFEILQSNGINILAVQCNDIDITIFLKDVDVDKGVKSLHKLVTLQ